MAYVSCRLLKPRDNVFHKHCWIDAMSTKRNGKLFRENSHIEFWRRYNNYWKFTEVRNNRNWRGLHTGKQGCFYGEKHPQKRVDATHFISAGPTRTPSHAHTHTLIRTHAHTRMYTHARTYTYALTHTPMCRLVVSVLKYLDVIFTTFCITRRTKWPYNEMVELSFPPECATPTREHH